MRIRIPIPKRVLAAYYRYEDWANEPIKTFKWRKYSYEMVRLDIAIAFFFFVCVGWYGYTSGPMGALVGGLMYVFMAMTAMWVLRRD